jgi:3-oxoacyl-[acyl-carrier protein] reductase
MRECAKAMMSAGYGRIVNFAAVATPLNLEGEAGYAASKAAVESLTRVAAKELAPFNITVNAVGPTPVMTDLIRSVPKQKMDALVATQAIRRMGEHRDIANVIDFFVSRDSDFITGQTIYLGGVN